MHFVICMFTSLVILSVCVLFTEVFPKWFKAILAVLGSYTTGYALMILIRYIAENTKAYAEPKLFPNVYFAAVGVLVVVVLVVLGLNKKNKA